MICPWCHYRHDNEDDMYGCPNCLGNPRWMDSVDRRRLTIKIFADESGYTETNIKNKIKSGMWKEDEVWVKAGNVILIDVPGFEAWARSGRKIIH